MSVGPLHSENIFLSHRRLSFLVLHLSFNLSFCLFCLFCLPERQRQDRKDKKRQKRQERQFFCLFCLPERQRQDRKDKKRQKRQERQKRQKRQNIGQCILRYFDNINPTAGCRTSKKVRNSDAVPRVPVPL